MIQKIFFLFKASPIFTNRKGVYVTTKAKDGNKKIRKVKASPIFTNRKGVCVTTKAKDGNKKIRKDVDKEESGLKF